MSTDMMPTQGNSAVEVSTPAVRWTLVMRVIFRIIAIYLFLYGLTCFLMQFTYLYYFLAHKVSYPVETAMRGVVLWVGKYVLGIHAPISTKAAGDSLFMWIEDFCFLLFSLGGASVWTLLDRGRPNYRTLDQWLRLWVRVTLAVSMFGYGFDKVFPLQFDAASRSQMVGMYGDLSLYDLVWQFLGASKLYTIFGGCLEVLAGLMLLVPSLSVAGALLCTVVLGNVVALNIAYNIPVKIVSSNLLLMAMFLVAPYAKRLGALLILNQPVEATPAVPLSTRRGIDLGARIAAQGVGLVLCVVLCLLCWTRYEKRQQAAKLTVPMQGIWQVEKFSVDGGGQRTLFTPKQSAMLHLQPEEEDWSRLIFDVPNVVTLQTVSGVEIDMNLAWDDRHATANLSNDADPGWRGHLVLTSAQDGRMNMTGTVNGVTVQAMLHKLDESRFLIKDDGIHWVQPN
jgi:hypothetical protein